MKTKLINLLFLFIPFALMGELKIFFIGDSITQGVGEEYGYVNILKKDLACLNYDISVLNYGKANTKSTVSRQILFECLKENSPDIVVICVGMVDAIYKSSLADLESCLNEMIDASLASNALVIVGLIDLSCWIWAPNYVEKFNLIYERLAKREDIRNFNFLNAKVLADKKYNVGDFIHPNQEGAKIISSYLYPKIIECLDELVRKTY